jgi:hypothetical protein
MAELITNPEFSRYLDDLEHEIDPSAASFWVCCRFFVAASCWACCRLFVRSSLVLGVLPSPCSSLESVPMGLHPNNTKRYSALYYAFHVVYKLSPTMSSLCIFPLWRMYALLTEAAHHRPGMSKPFIYK